MQPQCTNSDPVLLIWPGPEQPPRLGVYTLPLLVCLRKRALGALRMKPSTSDRARGRKGACQSLRPPVLLDVFKRLILGQGGLVEPDVSLAGLSLQLPAQPWTHTQPRLSAAEAGKGVTLISTSTSSWADFSSLVSTSPKVSVPLRPIFTCFL